MVALAKSEINICTVLVSMIDKAWLSHSLTALEVLHDKKNYDGGF
jgi:hypothetical protein